MSKFNSQFIKDAGIRALRTAAQVALSMFTIGKAFSEVDWVNVISVSLGAAVYSILTSIVTGLPESSTDGTLYITDTEDVTKMLFAVETDPDKWANRSSIRLKVDTTTPPPQGIEVTLEDDE